MQPMTAPASKAARIRTALQRAGCGHFEIHAFDEVDSTNSWLLRHPDLPSGSVCLADQQTAGRGRAGRTWHTPPGSAIALSLARDFPAPPQPALTLVAGVAVVRALPESRLQLKWPNDLLLEGRKVGGILVEAQGRRAVIGIGLNLALAPDEAIDQPWTNLPPGDPVERIARLIEQLDTACARFAADGFAPFADEWRASHAWQGREVEVLETEPWCGRIEGLRADGALLIAAAGRRRALTQAVGLRLAGAD